MITVLSLSLTVVFFLLSGIHLNWSTVGEWAFDAVIPVKLDGEKLFHPRKMKSFVIGILLLIFWLFYMRQGVFEEYSIWSWIEHYGGWAIGSLFLLRSIGDFKYVGFFKSVKTSDFDRLSHRAWRVKRSLFNVPDCDETSKHRPPYHHFTITSDQRC